MAQTNTVMTPPDVAESSLSFWDALESTCVAATALSRQVSSLLARGCSATECTPLLEQEKELVGRLGIQIQQVIGAETDPQARQRRDLILKKMQVLIAQDDSNRQLLGRQGITLNAGSKRRPHPRARA